MSFLNSKSLVASVLVFAHFPIDEGIIGELIGSLCDEFSKGSDFLFSCGADQRIMNKGGHKKVESWRNG